MVVHVMPRDAAVGILHALDGREVWVGGGWAVDALLREQTRDHDDLDLWLSNEAAEEAFTALSAIGLDRIFPWPGDRPWNFVLHDGGSRRVDLHFVERLPDDSLHYGPVAGGDSFPAAALAGHGVIGELPVRCESPAWALRWRQGYAPRSKDHHDVALLCRHFDLELPEPFRDGAER